jgi:hypothetical protein
MQSNVIPMPEGTSGNLKAFKRSQEFSVAHRRGFHGDRNARVTASNETAANKR